MSDTHSHQPSQGVCQPAEHALGVAPVDCSVVALTHYLPPYMERVLFHVARQIRDFRILLSIDREPNRHFDVGWEGLDVRVQKSLMLRRPWKHQTGFTDEVYIHFPYDTLRQLRKANPDIVFSYELGFRSLASLLYCRLYRKQLALCVCVSEHTEQGRGAARRMLRGLLLKSAKAVTFNGPSCRRYLEGFHVPDEMLFHFPYATSDLFQYTGPTERTSPATHRLLCVSQLSERKGILPMIDALATYCTEHSDRVVELDLVGSGHLEARLRDLNLPANMRLNMPGHLGYAQLAEKMQHVGLMIFPTLADEWGLVVNEALQAGLPVLGSIYAQACTTLIQPGQNGWLYDPVHPRELHDQLELFFSLSEQRLLPMRRNAQRSVQHITSSAVADKAVNMFRKLAVNH